MRKHLHIQAWAAFSVLALATSAAFAAPALTRAEVNAATLSARAAGTLVPAGEGIETRAPALANNAALTRSAVMADVLAARAAGQLVAAGEGSEPATLSASGGPVLARASVKADVLAARASGSLVPAGEGLSTETLQRSRAAAARMAQAHPQRTTVLETAGAPQTNTAAASQ